MIQLILGFITGGFLGYGFGLIQQRAAHRYAKLQNDGRLKHYIGVVPGSMRRVAFLLVVLVLVQIVCPMIFMDGTQWWVSGGVVVGYGLLLYLNLSNKSKAGGA
jgi:hypothetical protein